MRTTQAHRFVVQVQGCMYIAALAEIHGCQTDTAITFTSCAWSRSCWHSCNILKRQELCMLALPGVDALLKSGSPLATSTYLVRQQGAHAWEAQVWYWAPLRGCSIFHSEAFPEPAARIDAAAQCTAPRRVQIRPSHIPAMMRCRLTFRV